jgi:hypothetical protein
MSSIQKANPSVIKRALKDKEATTAEYKFMKALFQLGANKLLEAVKNDKLLLNARDLRDIHAIKSQVAVDDLDEAGIYFVNCQACIFGKSCSLFEIGSECKFNLRGGMLQSSKDIVEVMVKLLQIESDRIQRSLLIEKLEGGIDREVSGEIMQYFEMVDRLKNIMSKEESVEIKIKGRGAISRLFGDSIKKSMPVSPEEGDSLATEIVKTAVEKGSGRGSE